MWNKVRKICALFAAAVIAAPPVGAGTTRNVFAPIHPSWWEAVKTMPGHGNIDLSSKGGERGRYAPYVFAFRDSGITPQNFPPHPEYRLGAANATSLRASAILADKVAELAQQADNLPAGDKELPNVAAMLFKMGAVWHEHLTPESLEAAHKAYDVAHGKLSPAQGKRVSRRIRRVWDSVSWGEPHGEAAVQAPEALAASEGFRAAPEETAVFPKVFIARDLSEFEGRSFLKAMMDADGLKADLDADTAHSFALADKATIRAAAEAFAPEVYRKVLRIFKDGQAGLDELLDSLDGAKATPATLAAALRKTLKDKDLLAHPEKLPLNAVQLVPFLAIASGAGVLVRIDPKNGYINIGYLPGGSQLDRQIVELHVKSGRSFGIAPEHKALDASDVFYLTELGEYLRQADSVEEFYSAILKMLSHSNASGYASLDGAGQTVATDFQAIYTAELDRYVMTGLRTHSWQNDLLEATMVSAFAAPAGTIVRDGELSAGSPVDFFGKSKVSTRSGIGIMRRDRRKLQILVSNAARELFAEEIAAVERLIGRPKDGDIIHALAVYLNNPVNNEAVSANAEALTQAVSRLMSRIHQESGAVLRALPRPSPEALAARFVKSHSNGKLYPDVNDGNNGTFAYLLSGEDASLVAEVAAAYHEKITPPVKIKFDPGQQRLIAVRDSNDEVHFWVAIMDRRTGRITPVGSDMNTADLSYFLGENTFSRIFPGENYEFADGFDLMERLFQKGVDLDIGNTERGRD